MTSALHPSAARRCLLAAALSASLALSACSGPGPAASSDAHGAAASATAGAASSSTGKENGAVPTAAPSAASAAAAPASKAVAGWSWADGTPVMASEPTPDGAEPLEGTELDVPHPRTNTWSVATVTSAGRVIIATSPRDGSKGSSPLELAVAGPHLEPVSPFPAGADPYAANRSFSDLDMETLKPGVAWFPVDGSFTTDGAAFAWAASELPGDGYASGRLRIMYAPSVGQAPRVLATFPAQRSDGDFLPATDSLRLSPAGAGQRVYFSETSSPAGGASTRIRSVEVGTGGGAPRLEATDAARPSPTRDGMLAWIDEDPSAATARPSLARFTNGKRTVLLRSNIRFAKDSAGLETMAELQASPSGDVVYLPVVDANTTEGPKLTGGAVLRLDARTAVSAGLPASEFDSLAAVLCGESLLVDDGLEDGIPLQRISADGASTALRSPVRAAALYSVPVCSPDGDTVVYSLPYNLDHPLARFVVARYPRS
ncbi:hypothetical protein [Galactobacter valiniphilus]|uniref:hypothetical protein n=1 Tax=Galactobacter valiniphilus TaxID=2676122 RepID=UPI003736C2C1